MEEQIYTFKNAPAQTQAAYLRVEVQELVEALQVAEQKLVELEHHHGGGDDEIYIEGAILTVRAALAAHTMQAEPVAWDGKLPESLQRALNEMRVHCKPHIVSGLEFEVRQVFEGMHTSLSTVRRMYWAANARLEAIDEAQPDPFTAPQAQPAPKEAS